MVSQIRGSRPICFIWFASLVLAAVMVFGGLSILNMTPVGNASAADYSFSLPLEEVNVTVLRDGSVDIDYHFVFTNVGYLDGVDVGMPNKYYDGSSASAYIIVDGTRYEPSQIHDSPYVTPGMAVEFGTSLQSLIRSTGTFELYFHVNNPHMVYKNDKVNGTVGVSFRATWFDPSYQIGNTGNLVQKIIFPIGFNNASEALWLENNPWDSLYWDNASNRGVAMWTDSNVNPSSQENGAYDVGAGFPMVYVDRYYLPDAPDVWADIVSLILTLLPLLFFALVMVLVIMGSIAGARRRNGDYYDPEMNVVGAGPRRDLTAVEAAVVLERPLEIVATMILFSLIMKGKVEIVSRDAPMRLKKLADSSDRKYETEYLGTIRTDEMVDRLRLKNALVHLIQDTEQKMKGFDHAATMKYYEAICEKAWQQVKEANTPEDVARSLDEKSDWMMLDHDYPGRMRHEILPLPILIGSRGTPGASGPGLDIGKAAQDYVSSVQSAATNLVSDMRGLSRDVVSVTNPVPVSQANGWSGGGGGGHCACACACACAGGGR